MTALAPFAPIDWADVDARHHATLIGNARTHEAIDWFTARALVQAAKYPPAGIAVIVRAARAAAIVRTAELHVLTAAQVAENMTLIEDRAIARATERRAALATSAEVTV